MCRRRVRHDASVVDRDGELLLQWASRAGHGRRAVRLWSWQVAGGAAVPASHRHVRLARCELHRRRPRAARCSMRITLQTGGSGRSGSPVRESVAPVQLRRHGQGLTSVLSCTSSCVSFCIVTCYISHCYYFFATAAVAVDSSRMTGHHPLRGVDSVRLEIFLMGACRQCVSK